MIREVEVVREVPVHVPTLIVARTDSLAANLLTSDVDERDARFATGERTAEGFYRVEPGMAPVIARGSPSGRPHTARTCCSNWDVAQAPYV